MCDVGLTLHAHQLVCENGLHFEIVRVIVLHLRVLREKLAHALECSGGLAHNLTDLAVEVRRPAQLEHVMSWQMRLNDVVPRLHSRRPTLDLVMDVKCAARAALETDQPRAVDGFCANVT